ncbi:MAG TPA: acyl-CoA dehydrogenase family protein [Paenibacillus sp.]|jgi:alkylation response protein AidB-like acyl-CoA dehydrogenase
MPNIQNWFAVTEKQQHLLKYIGDITDRHTLAVQETDEANGFNEELVSELRTSGYPSFAVPSDFGGQDLSLTELLLCQERIAQVDAPSALAIGWHMTTVLDLTRNNAWDNTTFTTLCKSIVEQGAFVNRAETEAATGSPTRGGKPETRATRTSQGYVLNGRKTFTSLSPALDYFIVSAREETTDAIFEFLIPKETPGLLIDYTWNMLGMRGTASHDLVFSDVFVPLESHVYTRPDQVNPTKVNPYLLSIPACYLGIALAARQETITFAAQYQPNSLSHPIIQLPHIQQSMGQIELELSAARHYMYAVAARWEQDNATHPDNHAFASSDLAAVKSFAVNTAISVVDKAMRIVGVHSLSMSHPLQRMYRDVRFGLHNPPMDDVTLRKLAQRAIEEHK